MAWPTDWMTRNNHFFGEREIRELVFPSSHDAGTYKRSHGTLFGTADNVLTQNRSVFDQLLYGVRELDIRPALTLKEPQRWYCGHYTDTSIGWQGASCAPLDEVISDINKFTTTKHNELIIVRVSHIYKLNIEHDGQEKANTLPMSDPDWMSLLNLLEQIQNKYGLQQAGTSNMPLHDFKLSQFISGRPAVVVLVDGAPEYNAHLLAHGMWPPRLEETGPRRERLQLHQIDGLVSVSQNEADAILSTVVGITQSIPLINLLGIKNYSSVLNLANDRQNDRFPKLLDMAMEGWSGDFSKPSKIEMDRIENTDLLNFCLALSLKRNNIIAWRNDAVLVWGGERVDKDRYAHVYQKFNLFKDQHQNYPVHHDNFGLMDPWPGMIKSCAAIYEFSSAPKVYHGRWARQGSDLNLS